jgi:hypothetical protein|tara:strand:- start:904 stop:1458 length:555 start_codon:yes stop_codon:yes gene_type:complete
MQLMNSEKSLGLGIGYGQSGSTTNAGARQDFKNGGAGSPFDYMGAKNFKKGRRNEPIGETIDERDESKKLQKNFLNRANSIGTKGFGKQSVDYDDTEFLEKMFSNVDSDVRNISKANGSGHLNSVGNIKTQKELSVMEGNKLIEEELEKVTSRDAYNTETVKASPTKVIGIISEENSAPTIKTN